MTSDLNNDVFASVPDEDGRFGVYGGKFVAEWADPASYAALSDAFAGLDASDGWRAMAVRLALFDREAREVADRLGYAYPQTLSAGIARYIGSL